MVVSLRSSGFVSPGAKVHLAVGVWVLDHRCYKGCISWWGEYGCRVQLAVFPWAQRVLVRPWSAAELGTGEAEHNREDWEHLRPGGMFLHLQIPDGSFYNLQPVFMGLFALKKIFHLFC